MEGGPPREDPWDPITQGDVEDEDARPAGREAEEAAIGEDEEKTPGS